MSATIPCPAQDNGELLHRYVAGTLEEGEVEPFEIHLLECEACQRAVREGAALAAALRAREWSRRRALWWAIPGAAAAAVAAAIWLWPAEHPLRELGRVGQVPAFQGLPVRAQPDSASALVDRGMAAYVDGHYRRAAELLAAAAELDASPGVRFFLGIARLKTGAPREAVDALSGALDPPDNPYAAEARLYLAKGWLALGVADSALAHLAAIPPEAGQLHDHAVALADSVRQALD